jgi:hypothetical protein
MICAPPCIPVGDPCQSDVDGRYFDCANNNFQNQFLSLRLIYVRKVRCNCLWTKDKKQSKNCFYSTEWGCVVYVGQENDKLMYTAFSCIFGSVSSIYGMNC